MGTGGLKQPTAQFLDSIDQEREHHQQCKMGDQVVLAMTVVVFEVIALVFERIEGFIVHFPAGAASSHQRFDVMGSQCDIGDPAKKPLSIAVNFPIFQEIDPKVEMGLIL